MDRSPGIAPLARLGRYCPGGSGVTHGCRKDTLLGALWLDLNALETTGIEEATCKTVIAALEKGVQDSACFPRILPGHKLLSKIVERFSHEYYHWNDARKGSRGARQRHTRCNAMRAYKAVRFPKPARASKKHRTCFEEEVSAIPPSKGHGIYQDFLKLCTSHPDEFPQLKRHVEETLTQANGLPQRRVRVATN